MNDKQMLETIHRFIETDLNDDVKLQLIKDVFEKNGIKIL